MDGFSLDNDKAMSRGNKILKMEPFDSRLQCCVSCGADHVVDNVWPYLLPLDFVCSYMGRQQDNEDNDSIDNENEEEDDNV